MPPLAAAEGAGGVDLGLLGQYGILGLFAVLLILFARTSYRRETERADRQEADLKALNNAVQERVIPTLLSATRAIEDCTELLRSMQRERELYRRGEGP